MLDYWGLSFKQAARDLRATLWPSVGEAKPADRRWRIAVCGPHPPPQVELGPDFETTWDPKGADFAMMLGEFYCARFDAPLLVDIVRDGVSFARVYDIRGRSFETLFTRRRTLISTSSSAGARIPSRVARPAVAAARAATIARRCGSPA